MSLSEDEIQALHNQSIGRLFLQAHRDFQARVFGKLQTNNENITPTHLMVMSQFASGEMRVNDLAARLKITKQSASHLIADLEAQGYIERRPDPNDKRAAIISFTPLGEKFLAETMQIIPEIDPEYAALLGQEDFEQLVRLLTRLLSTPDSTDQTNLAK